MAKDAARPPVRITNQFRKGQAMVYDLSCEEVRLTIEVTSVDGRDGLGEWNVGAHTRQTPEKPTIDERGHTRREALGAVASTWKARCGALGFPALDWEAVTQALVAVRAV